MMKLPVGMVNMNRYIVCVRWMHSDWGGSFHDVLGFLQHDFF